MEGKRTLGVQRFVAPIENYTLVNYTLVNHTILIHTIVTHTLVNHNCRAKML